MPKTFQETGGVMTGKLTQTLDHKKPAMMNGGSSVCYVTAVPFRHIMGLWKARWITPNRIQGRRPLFWCCVWRPVGILVGGTACFIAAATPDTMLNATILDCMDGKWPRYAACLTAR